MNCRSLSIRFDQQNQFGRLILERIRDCRINDLIRERDLGIRDTRGMAFGGGGEKRSMTLRRRINHSLSNAALSNANFIARGLYALNIIVTRYGLHAHYRWIGHEENVPFPEM